MTKEYGNYEKYENNSIEEELEGGTDDIGNDKYIEHYYRMMRNLPIDQGEEIMEGEKENFEDLLTNQEYTDASIAHRHHEFQQKQYRWEEEKEKEDRLKFVQHFMSSNQTYQGRMSPVAK